MREIWKGWIGVILVGIGIISYVKNFEIWLLLISAIGIFMIFIDRKNITANKNNKQIFQVTLIVVLIMLIQDLVSIYW